MIGAMNSATVKKYYELQKQRVSLKGNLAEVDAIDVDGTIVVVTNKFLRIAEVKDELCQEEINNPASIVTAIRNSELEADIFTFDQKLPNVHPRYPYYHEFDDLAVLHITSYEQWWNKEIHNDARRMVRKAEKAGVETRLVSLDNDLLKGIKEIWDETPLRRGRPCYHYGHDFETVRQLNSTYGERTEWIGAYWKEKLIGFAKMFYTGERADIIQLISLMSHKDKSVNNVLLSKTVQVCVTKGIKYLCYSKYIYGKRGADSLTEFKKRNGFHPIQVPRYYIPLTLRGKVAVRFGLHKGIIESLPHVVLKGLLCGQHHWHMLRSGLHLDHRRFIRN